MADIYDYLRALVLQAEEHPPIFSSYVRPDELVEALVRRFGHVIDQYASNDLIDPSEMAYRFFDELSAANVIVSIEEEFAGTYSIGAHQRYLKFRENDLSNNTIVQRSKAIGSRYYPDVFAGYRAKHLGGNVDLPALGVAPASNRIVSFSDNQISELDEQTTAVIEAVKSQNQIASTPGLRELILGQLRAGRELVRAGSARIYLLNLTLIETLKFLARRYDGELIGGLASALIAVLLKHLGMDA